ncbi:hypothetical protein KI387_025508, partial [Taxus chinensis]
VSWSSEDLEYILPFLERIKKLQDNDKMDRDVNLDVVFVLHCLAGGISSGPKFGKNLEAICVEIMLQNMDSMVQMVASFKVDNKNLVCMVKKLKANVIVQRQRLDVIHDKREEDVAK